MELLSKVPENILAVLIGSGITLFGVFLQGVIAFVLLRREKAMDVKHSQEDRIYELKKEYYLSGLQGFMHLMNGFMDFTKPGQDFDEYGKSVQKHFLQLAPIDLVAEKRTLESVHNFQKYFLKIYTDLMKEKIPVESLVIDKTSKENRYNYYSKKIDENIVLINNNRFTGTEQEQNYVKFLNERYEELSKEREKYAGEINVISQKLLETEMEFKKKATEKLLMLNQFLTEYIQSARNDLGCILTVNSVFVSAEGIAIL
jgi:hypothetical protein